MNFIMSVVFLIFLSFMALARGAEFESKAVAKEETEKKATNKLLKQSESGLVQTFSSSISTDLRDTNDASKRSSSNLDYSIGYNLKNDYKIRFSSGLEKDLSHSYKEFLKDSKLFLSRRPYHLSKSILSIPAFSLIIPTSKKSKLNEELILGSEISNVFLFLIGKQLSFAIIPKVRKNFHHFETSRSNQTNNEYAFQQTYSLEYAFNQKFYVSATLLYMNFWSYTGRRKDPTYLSNLELGFNMNESITLAFGSVQGGSLYDVENGSNKSIELYEQDTTQLYMQFLLRV